MIRVILYCFFVLFFISSCQEVAPERVPSQGDFFDLKAYFTQEVKKLSKLRGFSKTTQINGKKETHQFDTLDFSTELAMFINADINRITWLDKYQVDSTFTEQESLATITYQALTPEMKTQKLYVAFMGNQPNLIQIEQLTDNALMNATMNLEYIPEKSYRIQSNQKLRLSEEREMIVKVDLP